MPPHNSIFKTPLGYLGRKYKIVCLTSISIIIQKYIDQYVAFGLGFFVLVSLCLSSRQSMITSTINSGSILYHYGFFFLRKKIFRNLVREEGKEEQLEQDLSLNILTTEVILDSSAPRSVYCMFYNNPER